MKKIIVLFITLFFVITTYAQKNKYSKETSDTFALVGPCNNSVSVTLFGVSNGFAGISYVSIIGDNIISDTLKWGLHNFDYRDNGTTRAFSIFPLRCGTEYTMELVTKCKNLQVKKLRRTFVTTKCVEPIKISTKKKRSWWHRFFFGNEETEKSMYQTNKNPAGMQGFYFINLF